MAGFVKEKIAAEKAARLEKNAKFEAAYKKAVEAGNAAGAANKPHPMIVQEREHPFGGAVTKEWFVGEGACGFAWVTVYPGNHPFANWLKKNNYARKAYGGGVQIWISAFGQSVERKEACANEMAKVLREELEIKEIYAGSRLD